VPDKDVRLGEAKVLQTSSKWVMEQALKSRFPLTPNHMLLTLIIITVKANRLPQKQPKACFSTSYFIAKFLILV